MKLLKNYAIKIKLFPKKPRFFFGGGGGGVTRQILFSLKLSKAPQFCEILYTWENYDFQETFRNYSKNLSQRVGKTIVLLRNGQKGSLNIIYGKTLPKMSLFFDNFMNIAKRS